MIRKNGGKGQKQEDPLLTVGKIPTRRKKGGVIPSNGQRMGKGIPL